jgi:hypothetical protein
LAFSESAEHIADGSLPLGGIRTSVRPLTQRWIPNGTAVIDGQPQVLTRPTGLRSCPVECRDPAQILVGSKAGKRLPLSTLPQHELGPLVLPRRSTGHRYAGTGVAAVLTKTAMLTLPMSGERDHRHDPGIAAATVMAGWLQWEQGSVLTGYRLSA